MKVDKDIICRWCGPNPQPLYYAKIAYVMWLLVSYI